MKTIKNIINTPRDTSKVLLKRLFIVKSNITGTERTIARKTRKPQLSTSLANFLLVISIKLITARAIKVPVMLFIKNRDIINKKSSVFLCLSRFFINFTSLNQAA